jgi:hypothetical protein
LGLLSTPNPFLSGIRKVSEFYLKKNLVWNSALNAQGSRGIIVPVQVGAVKLYVAYHPVYDCLLFTI